MRKSRFIAFGIAAVSLVASAVPAFAQDYLGAHLQAQRDANIRLHQQRMVKNQQAKRRGAAKEQRMSKRQWECARRYRGYDISTDRYVVRPGVTAKCPLS
ncbi:BA14K family protein [Sphingobium sp. BHU LFT2]|uniref:BA14K family protein n=1 Tax=Sphingobium sp. BHU LFT2 TaxID=2807634 RepID=UPI001BE4E881|nr:BA14K family protein [Sphingobium sp. BHU LFT2]MBT2245803.1 BA14K family protein [Sphingobium sp. BHU LFT2]